MFASGRKALNAVESPVNVPLMPKFTVGTTVTNCCQKLMRITLPPKFNEWLPRDQFKLSMNCLTGELRRCGPVVIVALVAPAELIARLTPFWFANCDELTCGKNRTVPPVKPNRASFTMLLLMVQRHAVVFEKRFES